MSFHVVQDKPMSKKGKGMMHLDVVFLAQL
jgi:hypothetical protein